MKVKYSKEILAPIVKNSRSLRETLLKLNIVPIGSNYETLKKYIKLHNIDTSHFKGQGWRSDLAGKDEIANFKINDILSNNNNFYFKSSYLKTKLIANHLKENKCENCGISGTDVTLELHHIDGNHFNNQFENLQLLCPNCHSKTNGWRVPKKYDYDNISYLEKELKEHPICHCKNCNKEFISNRVDRKRNFCSYECYREYISKYKERNLRSNIELTQENLTKLCNECKTMTEISQKIGLSRTTVRKILIEHDLLDFMKNKYDFHSKIIQQFDVNGNLIKEWPSIDDASETLHIFSIEKVCSGKRRSAGGFIWRYKT